MSTTPIPQLEAIKTAAASAASASADAVSSANSISDLASQVQGIIDGSVETIQSLKDKNGSLTTQIQTLSDQLTQERKRKPTKYFSLEKFPLFVADRKIPFQWIQPGNTGNTGGGSADAHGSETWVPGPNGTKILPVPKNIAPKSDNFDNYMVLPYPTVPPRRLNVSAKNYSAATPVDWAKTQQFEGPVHEYIGGGFQNTSAWAFNPRTGLHYWGGAIGNWVPFLDVNGKPILINLDHPTSIEHETSIDHVAHTFTYDWVLINGVLYTAGKTVNAVPVPATRQEYSVAVQLDSQAGAPSYQAILDGLNAEWE